LVPPASRANQGVQVDGIDEANALVASGGGEIVQMSAQKC
jgi:hypothetical protein